MELDTYLMNLIFELETKVGNECYNPHSYDGWTGEQGCSFRYSVWYDTEDGNSYKTKYKVGEYDSEVVNTMRYKFGANELYIGLALKNLLSHLENRYHINFNQLEVEYCEEMIQLCEKNIQKGKKLTSKLEQLLQLIDLKQFKDINEIHRKSKNLTSQLSKISSQIENTINNIPDFIQVEELIESLSMIDDAIYKIDYIECKDSINEITNSLHEAINYLNKIQ